jgi:hypothetical protein
MTTEIKCNNLAPISQNDGSNKKKQTCSLCKIEGHRINNKRFHPKDKTIIIYNNDDITPLSEIVSITDKKEKKDKDMKTQFQIFRERKFQESIKDNDKELIEAAYTKEPWLITRIENYRSEKMTDNDRESNTCDSIIDGIKNDTNLFRSIFRKDTTRQTLHEKAQIEWIQQHLYDDAIKLKSNINGTCLSKSKFHVISGANPRPSGATKTFDIYVPSKNIYAVLKHTSVPGGAQDNQFADVKHFVSEEIGYLENNPTALEIFVFYLDGEYYTTKKIKVLEDMIPEHLKNRILITNCASIVSNISNSI